MIAPKAELLAIRCHDVTVSLDGTQVGDFDRLVVLGMAVRLALHLRGCPAVPYDLLRQVALHWLKIPPTSLPNVIELLAEASFVSPDKQGSTLRSVIPTVPYYEDLFAGIGEIAENESLSEPEQLTLAILQRLSRSPTSKNTLLNSGAEAKLVNKSINIGQQGGYVIGRRARGRDMLVSPIYFSENAIAFADLAAGVGSGKLGKVVSLRVENPGWPLSLSQTSKRIGDSTLTHDELEIVAALAGEGFTSPPAIETSHAGKNFFLFSPRPSAVQLSPANEWFTTKQCMIGRFLALVVQGI